MRNCQQLVSNSQNLYCSQSNTLSKRFLNISGPNSYSSQLEATSESISCSCKNSEAVKAVGTMNNCCTVKDSTWIGNDQVVEVPTSPSISDERFKRDCVLNEFFGEEPPGGRKPPGNTVSFDDSKLTRAATPRIKTTLSCPRVSSKPYTSEEFPRDGRSKQPPGRPNFKNSFFLLVQGLAKDCSPIGSIF